MGFHLVAVVNNWEILHIFVMSYDALWMEALFGNLYMVNK
jgi:hypothetical protein